jgi:hypothetical protein
MSESVASHLSLKEWIEKSQVECQANFASNTGNTNKHWTSAFDRLIELGCTKVLVGKSDAEHGEMDELFIELPENVSPSLICYICNLQPNEISLVSEKVIKLWWD